MGIGLGIFSNPAGSTMLADFAQRAENLVITTNEHGLEKCSFDVPMSLWEAFSWYDPSGLPWVIATWNGMKIAAGRLEDRKITQGSVSFQALGPWRSLMDIPYTALWSKTTYDGFVPMRPEDNANRTPDKWEMDTNNRIYLAPKKNENFANGADGGCLTVPIPYLSSRQIVGVQFDYEYKAPVNWNARFDTMTDAFGGIAAQATVVGNGAVQTGSFNLTFTACDRIGFLVVNATGGNVLKATDTGVDYLKITNLRYVTTLANRVNTTFTNAIVAGAGKVVTPASMANIYLGQRLIISSGSGTIAESVIVTAITSTTFTATFAFAHAIGNTIQAHVVYADEVAKDMAAAVNALNSAQLSASSALIQSPALDLTDEVYEDATMADVLTTLASYGDNAATPNMYEVGVDVFDTPLLFFRPLGSAGSTWYVDVSDIDVERSLDALENSGYATYDDPNNRTLRSSTNTDTNSVARYGLTRRAQISVRTTSSVQAGVQRDASLADTKDPTPRAGIVFSALYDAAGARHQLFEAAANDTILIRNLPPALATTIDKIRSFRIGRTEYSADDDTLAVEPATPIPSLEFMLSRLAIGVK